MSVFNQLKLQALPASSPLSSPPRHGCGERHGFRAARWSRAGRECAVNARASPSGLDDDYLTIADCVGGTPLVKLQRLRPPGGDNNTILLKLEGDNPAGSVKDRPALSMIVEAERKGLIKPGDTLIEATSGNTGIAMAMAAAIKGYKLRLIMPANMSEERRASMRAYGAQLINAPAGEMETAREMALEMQARGEGLVLNQFGNRDNPLAHYRSTGPEIWEATKGRVTHFVSSMGTTGTIMGVSRFLKERNPNIQIVGLQPGPGASIAGIRRWPKEYLPTIFEPHRVDSVMEISAREAEETMRCLARVEGVLAGVSSGGAVSAALRLSARVQNAVIAVIICDRGDRYLSTGAFSEAAAAGDPAPCNVEEWPSAAARLPFHPAPHYVWVSADYDARTGQPWCPDCERSMQAAREVVRAAGGTLLEVQVGSRPQWKDAGHPFRLDPALRLTGVPTLIHWVAGAPAARLGPELEAAKTQEQAAQLIHSFVASTAAPSAASTLSKPANISAHQTATL